MRTIARIPLAGLAVGLCLHLPGPAHAAAGPTTPSVVYLAAGLTDADLLRLGAAVAGRPGSILLLDSPTLTPYLRHFLAAHRPTRIVPVGVFPGGREGLQSRLRRPVEPPIPVDAGLWLRLYPRADQVVVCPPHPRRLMLQAACLAGAMNAPLWIAEHGKADDPVLRRCLTLWNTRRTTLVGLLRGIPSPAGMEITLLADEQAVARAHLAQLARRGPVATAVIANADDFVEGPGATSALAPWLAVSRRAVLLLTSPGGRNVDSLVQRAARVDALRQLDTLIMAGSPRAIPTRHRPNPIPGDKDQTIEMEPLTPTGTAPFSYAIGRLFHEDRAVVPLLLARQQLLRTRPGPRRALVASNPGGGLGLLEAFSRQTTRELANVGYQVEGLFNGDLSGPLLRRGMVGPEMILWEGHHNTLVKDWGFVEWDEPMPPAFVFLQSCLALQDYKVAPLLRRGAVGVLGTSTRTYSASGGAFSLAYFNALMYDRQSLGGSLRHAKNFLLSYSLLKQKRLGPAAALTGANLRAAWAFTLWADPTYQPPRPTPPGGAIPAVRTTVKENCILIDVPAERHAVVASARFRIEAPANARLAGLLRKPAALVQPVVPLVFAEVRLPSAPAGQTPRLRSTVSSKRWQWLWDARRQTGYLLVTPRGTDAARLQFDIEWSGPRVVGATPDGDDSGS